MQFILHLPNHLHAAYTIRAADAGIHVFAKNRWLLSAKNVFRMIEAAEENGY